jgi:hypothetical protein
MKLNRVFFLIGALWELLRFLLLFAALLLTFHPLVIVNRQAVYWLLLFGSPQLLLSAGLLVLYAENEPPPALLNLVRLGKVLAVFSSLLLFVLEPLSWRPGLAGSLLAFLATPLIILLGVLFIDLVFLLFLLSYSPRREENNRPKDSLPVFKESRIPDED